MGINPYPRNLNPTITWTKQDRQLTQDALFLLLSIYNRTGGAGGVPNLKLGVVAAGTTQVGAAQLTGDWNFVSTVTANSGVILPVLAAGSDCIVFNDDANPLKIYPAISVASPIQIDALGNNNPYSLPANKMQWFRARDAQVIRSMQLG